MKTLMHIAHGRVDVDVAGEGHCDLWIVNAEGYRIHVGLYDNSDFAIADIDQQAMFKHVMSAGSARTYWLVRSAAPGERELPVFTSDHHDAPILGYARTRLEACQYAGSAGVAYRAAGCGPRGEEGWVVL